MAITKAVMLIGGSGFVGSHLALKLREKYKVIATYYTRPIQIDGVTSIPMDITNENWIKRVAYTFKPEVIIYVAGNNSLEYAEAEENETEKMHTGGPANVLNNSDILQPRFIYLSNCYAFDGHRGNYRESDTIMPSSILGKAKVAGENFIKGKSLNYVIIRSSPAYGRGNGKKLSWFDVLRTKLDRKERVELPGTELHSYVPIYGLTDIVSRLIDSGPRNRILHYGGLTKVTPYELGRALAQKFGYDPNLVILKRAAAKKVGGATREGEGLPDHDFSLNSSQMIEALKIKPLLLEEGFDLLNENLVGHL